MSQMTDDERPFRSLSLGCLPAALFGVVVGLPAALVTLMAECSDESGVAGDCPNEGLFLLAVIIVTGSFCLLILWITDRIVGELRRRDWGVGWGVAAGFALAITLAGLMYMLVIGLR